MQQEATYSRDALRLPLPPRSGRVFAFDLDGTITSLELLPLIARLAGLEAELAQLTRLTLSGEINFEESFRKRFDMLRHIPLELVRESVAAAPLDPHICAFIQSRPEQCVIVTGNLDLWVMPLLIRLGCRYFASRGAAGPDGLSLLSVLDKAEAARRLLAEGREIIAIGESVNDAPLFRSAAVGIAFAGVHAPVPAIRRLARCCVADGASLCRLLENM